MPRVFLVLVFFLFRDKLSDAVSLVLSFLSTLLLVFCVFGVTLLFSRYFLLFFYILVFFFLLFFVLILEVLINKLFYFLSFLFHFVSPLTGWLTPICGKAMLSSYTWSISTFDCFFSLLDPFFLPTFVGSLVFLEFSGLRATILRKLSHESWYGNPFILCHPVTRLDQFSWVFSFIID